MAKILFVEDDLDAAKVVIGALEHEHHRVEHSTDGLDALERLLCCEYDLAVLDWNVPGKSGIELARDFRNKGGRTPILMLTGNAQASQKVSGLDAGADDYLTKPFDIEELRARVRALLRRGARSQQSNELKVGELVLDPATMTVTYRGADVAVVRKEFQLLEFLMRHPNMVFSPDAILKRVWTIDEEASAETIRTYIKNLRRKLDVDGEPSMIENIRGIGYKLVPPKS